MASSIVDPSCDLDGGGDIGMGICKGSRRYHLNTNEAFAAYEAVRHRLPDVQRSGRCQKLPNLDAIAEEFDVFLLDAFGVLNIGEVAIAGVPERVAGLQAAGKRVLVVSNAAGYPHDVLMNKYLRLGYDFAPEDVITSRKATLHALKNQPRRHYGLIADAQYDHADIQNLDVSFLADDASVYDGVEAFLMLGAATWTQERQALLAQSLRRNPRPVYIGNPDIVAPREGGFSAEPGSYAHQLADETGLEPLFLGKPFSGIYDLAFQRLGDFDPERTVMVGDSLHTDILGAHTAGIKSALIAGYGFFDGTDVDGPIAVSGIRPDYILDRP